MARPSQVWTYRNASGALLFIVCRFDKVDGSKVICPLTYCSLAGSTGWRWKAPLAPRPLYGLDRLAKRPNAAVIICEGEKAADEAERLFPEFVAVTSPNGARAADKADWTVLVGRSITIWPDHDDEGSGYAADVVRLARQAGAASVFVVQVPKEFPDKWDLADEAPSGWTPKRLRQLVNTAAMQNVWADTAPESTPTDAALKRLASLPAIDYERQREDAAKELGIRKSALDREVACRRADASGGSRQGRSLELPSPDPWPTPVEGASLLNQLTANFSQYLALPDGAAEALALWVLHTHAFAVSPITPRLALTSPEKRCGKTTCLRLIGALAARPLMAANITPAALFRTIEAVQPCLLIDEADSFLKDNDGLRGIVNAGHARDGAVIRTVGDENEPRQFSAWAPVVIACIGELPGTIADRSIIVPMRRRRPDEAVERLRFDRVEIFRPLARKCARWTTDRSATLAAADPQMPSFLHDRAADNWRPLFAIADAAGGDWPTRARESARLMSAGEAGEDDSIRAMLLVDIKAIFAATDLDRLPSATIVARLGAMEHRPWPEWKNGKAITARQLARLLAPFGITPQNIRTGDEVVKGYLLATFTDAFARYLPTGPLHRYNVDEISHSVAFQSATGNSGVADRDDKKASNDAGCGCVADGKRQNGSGVEEWVG